MGIEKLILRKNQESEEYNRKKPNKIIIFILISAVLILVLGSFFDGGEKKEEKTEKISYTSEETREEEKRLELILKKINGAGDVSVFISYEDGGEMVLARDIKSKVEEESDGTTTSKNSEDESTVVMVEEGSDTSPYVTEERKPEVSGILVVAEGASAEKVRNEIYDAVKAIYGVAAHRIKITY